MAKLLEFLSANNPEYLAAVLLCYGCFLRPKELALLRCSDIDLKNQVVHIRAEIAKNDSDSYRTIPGDIFAYVSRLDLTHPDWYVFAKHGKYDFSPGPEKVCSRKLAKYWSDHVRKACDFSEELQFYSLKDTGITAMLNRGVSINKVQHQADHSSVAMTAIYVGQSSGPEDQIKDLRML